MRKSGKILGLIVLLVVAYGLVVRLVTRLDDMTSNWKQFHNEIVSNYFKLPPEIELVSAEYSDLFMGMNFRVAFSLPQTHTPAVWISRIAADSEIESRFRRSEFEYDCEEECDLYRLFYDSESETYIVEAGWD